MSQPVRRGHKTLVSRKHRSRTSISRSSRKNHPKYGTSKLEVRFMREFLDKLGVEYKYQYEMRPIGRFLDFYIPSSRIAIEVDGDYWHGKGLLHEEKNPTQKHNERVDKQKNHWCAINGIRLLRIWEDDINNHPEKVMKFLKMQFRSGRDEAERLEKKNMRH